MNLNGIVQIVLYLVVLLALVKPLGSFMARVYQGEPCGLDRVLGSIENLIYRACGIRREEEMTWQTYTGALLLFSLAGLLSLYLLQRLQGILPLNPQRLPAVSAESSFNTAVSFVTNTNWQGYGGETTMSYLTQMAGLAVQNFVSAASGMAVLVALIRGFARRTVQTIGNFWVDLTRGTLYILLPLSLVLALLLVSQGVVQSFSPYRNVPLVQAISYDKPRLDAQGNPVKDAAGKELFETVTVRKQILPSGPAASQVAIKQLGTNGGGFFNANSAHPFENPTPWTNFWQMLAIFMVPAGLTYTYGRMAKNQKHGWALWAAMFVLFIGGVATVYWAEARGNPIHAARGVDIVASAVNPGGNMEGKEVRFGIANSALYATMTTDASCGCVNAMHDSFTPIGGLVPLVNMQLGEVVFGGVGAGLYGMLVMVVLTVFLAGLMVGRTPEYLGKKIQAPEVQMALLYVLVFTAAVLTLTAIASATSSGLVGRNNAGPHGLSEILYAFTSTAANNGSAFGGLTGTTSFYNTLLGLNTLIGRFAMQVPLLALAGFLAEKKIIAESAGSFPVTTPLFVMLLVAVILIVSALTFFPVLSLGPVVEHFLMHAGRLF